MSAIDRHIFPFGIIFSLFMSGCANTIVTDYDSLPDLPAMVGVGGAARTINGIKVWFDGGSPSCKFRVISGSTAKYWTGASPDRGETRESVLKDLAVDAIKSGADAVIVFRESKEVTGFVAMLSSRVMTATQPGFTGSNITYSISSAIVKCQQQ